MCGRFVIFSDLDRLKEFFPIDKVSCDVTPNYNVAPTQEILSIVNREGQNWLDKFHWGLVPFWAKEISIGNKAINARAETVATTPSFRNAFKNRRCLILADGFYEWKGKKGQKQPMFLTLPEGNPFAFAGLWDQWRLSTGDPLETFTILTTQANDCVRPIHDRMPVILASEAVSSWIEPEDQDPRRQKHRRIWRPDRPRAYRLPTVGWQRHLSDTYAFVTEEWVSSVRISNVEPWLRLPGH